mgnify:CR=1 FL=1
MSFFYLYLTNPFKALQLYQSRSIVRFSLLTIALVAVMVTAQLDRTFVIRQLFWMAVIAGSLLVQAVLIDFVAQVQGYVSQSYRLFQWLAMSLLPLCILQPIIVLYRSAMLFTSFWSLLVLLVLALVVSLQIRTVRYLYQPSFRHQVLLFLMPVLSIAAFMMLVLTYLGAVLFSGAP